MSTLTSARITFQTGSDDKRKESSLAIGVRDKLNEIVAWAANSYGQFDNQTTNGPFDLVIANQVEMSNIRPGGSMTLSWTPWNDPVAGTTDEWHFALSLELTFADGHHLVLMESGLRLTAAQPVLTFGL